MDSNRLIQDGTTFAAQAVNYDKENNHQQAHSYYMKAAEAILKAIASDRSLDALKVKALQYIERAETLQKLLDGIDFIQFHKTIKRT